MIDLYEYKGRTLSGACGTIFDVLLLLEIFVEECIRYFLVGASWKDEFKSCKGATLRFLCGCSTNGTRTFAKGYECI